MKKLTLLLALAASLGVSTSTRAQILVGPGGVGPITFDATPPVTEWSTRNGGIVDTSNSRYGDANSIEAGVQTVTASGQTVALVVDNNYGSDARARHNQTAGHLFTQCTGADATLLMATLRNNTIDALSHITVSYDFGIAGSPAPGESSPGLVAFFSTNGQAGSWVRIPEFTGQSADASVSATIFVGTWAPGGDIYLLWADDNAQTGADGTNTIDSFTVSNPVVTNAFVPLATILNAPVNNQIYVVASGTTADVQMTATASGSAAADSVTFVIDGVDSFTDTSAPYSNTVALASGSHTIYARAINDSEIAYSVTNTIFVRSPFIEYVGGTHTENFDSMGTANGLAPQGWYGQTNSAGTPFVTNGVIAGNGSVAPNTTFIWNYGTTGDADRALGTAATATERSIVARIRNNTSQNITSFEFHYAGEVWRNYTNQQFGITNLVSFDNGANWITTTSYWLQPFPAVPPPGAVNGNDPANRVADVSGVIVPPNPIPPNGVIYLRWRDVNEGGTDGALAVDDFTFTATLGQFTASVTITNPPNGSAQPLGAPITVSAGVVLANPLTNIVFYHDGISPENVISNRTAPPYTVSYTGAGLGNHTLHAVATDNTGFSVTSAVVSVDVQANVGPSITITNPVSGREFLVGTMITNFSASAGDPLGTIAYVEFYDNGVYRTSDTNAHYGVDFCDITAGTHVLMAVAVDSSGARASNSITVTVTNPPNVTFIVTNGAVWKYLDNGTNFGATLWQAPGFDDSGWASGLGEFGYGDAPGRPERTTVSFGTNANNKHITTYFRKTFNVSSLAGATDLTLSVLRDDAAVVYINGAEVFRTGGLPEGPITAATVATNDASDDGTVYFPVNLPTSVLAPGDNTIAVELHQSGNTSSDISFDLMLWANGGARPRLTIVDNGNGTATISWGAEAAGHALESAPTATGSWTPVQNLTGAGQITVPSNSGNQFYIIR